jgi:hypothetical protein
MQIDNLGLPIVMAARAQEHSVQAPAWRVARTPLLATLRNPGEAFGITVSSCFNGFKALFLRQRSRHGMLATLAFAKVRFYMRQYFASPMFWIMTEMF